MDAVETAKSHFDEAGSRDLAEADGPEQLPKTATGAELLVTVRVNYTTYFVLVGNEGSELSLITGPNAAAVKERAEHWILGEGRQIPERNSKRCSIPWLAERNYLDAQLGSFTVDGISVCVYHAHLDHVDLLGSDLCQALEGVNGQAIAYRVAGAELVVVPANEILRLGIEVSGYRFANYVREISTRVLMTRIPLAHLAELGGAGHVVPAFSTWPTQNFEMCACKGKFACYSD